jgi:hypothetical protein
MKIHHLKTKSFIQLFIGLISCASLVIFPSVVLAATVHLNSDLESVSVGDTVAIRVEMDTEDQTPNTIEGRIVVSDPKKIEISKTSTAGSVLTVWPQNPISDGESAILFTGGVPGGFNQKSAPLFAFFFLAKEEGLATFSFSDLKAYDNDGKATPIDVLGSDLTVQVGSKKADVQRDQWEETIASDLQPPENIIATFGQDASLFEGKKLIQISAVDRQSGIEYFEIKEGRNPAVRSGDVYVLMDQSETSRIQITAYDYAGNHSQIILTPRVPSINYWRVLLGMLIFVGFLYGLYRTFISTKKLNVAIKR